MNNQDEVAEAIRNVLKDFSSKEYILQEKLNGIQNKREENSQGRLITIPLNFETYQESIKTKELALKRNKALKKELDTSMGKLRSKRCYSPAEDNLHKTIQRYSAILSSSDID